MQIVPYPHPALSFRSVEIQQIDAVLRKTVSRMFELMYEAKGIGLAANQVGLPFRFFVMNLAGRPGGADEEFVFLNPLIRHRRGQAVAEEGCLSLPGLYGDVRRAESLIVEAFDLDGEGFELELDDLPARVVQHETDHLDGILFTDRMREEENGGPLELQLPKYVAMYQRTQREGRIPSDEQLRAELEEMAGSGRIPDWFPERQLGPIPVPDLEN